jgi:hypothetical protein
VATRYTPSIAKTVMFRKNPSHFIGFHDAQITSDTPSPGTSALKRENLNILDGHFFSGSYPCE